ncbi:hypothetical protein [Kribbella catacumbae]|uniref:hypothetical protein n=1 Tax=Kribbella catacumbae TaxID=460086 RepID=UPI0003778659|nr:hypothetical protein [Kribbella catacumbae]
MSVPPSLDGECVRNRHVTRLLDVFESQLRTQESIEQVGQSELPHAAGVADGVEVAAGTAAEVEARARTRPEQPSRPGWWRGAPVTKRA